MLFDDIYGYGSNLSTPIIGMFHKIRFKSS